MFWMTKKRVQRTRSAEDDDDDSEPVFRIDRRTLQQDGGCEEQPWTAVLRRQGR